MFVEKGTASIGLKVIKFCSIFAMSAELYAVYKSPITFSISTMLGLSLILLSATLFWLSVIVNNRKKLSLAFSPDLPEHLVKSGPYRFVRHPFYLSYLLTYAAGFLVTGNYWLVPIFTLMFAIYYWAARFEESKFLKSDWADEYLKYKAKAGLLLPKIFIPARSKHSEKKKYSDVK